MTQKVQARMREYWPAARALLVIGGILIVLISLVRWGGTARPGPLFVAGVALLTGIILVFGLVVAWIYGGRSTITSSSLKPEQIEIRQAISILALISTCAFVLGGVWDETWHRRFGGFGDDFLWPPHLLIYSSIALFGLFAVSGLWRVVRNVGTLRERLRSEGQLSILALVCTFLIVSLPSDIVWHQVYGKDITAWSLPHIIVGGGVALVALVSAGLALVSLPRQEQWRDLRQLRYQDVIGLLLITNAVILILQLGTVEWEGIKSLIPQSGVFDDAFWHRPQWLYPVVVVTISLFASTFTVHLLRCAGGATLIALLITGFRFVCSIALRSEFDQAPLSLTAQVLLFSPAIALDLWYLLRKPYADTLTTLVSGNLIAASSFLIVGLPLIERMMIYPPINGFTVPRMIIMSLVMALAAGWIGARFGGWLGSLSRSAVLTQFGGRVLLYSFVGTTIVLVIFVSIVLTAQEPLSVSLR